MAHLLIIGVASAINAFKFKVRPLVKTPVRHMRRDTWTKAILSHVLVAVIFAFMFASFTVAVRTGFREGQTEPQVIFVKNQVAKVSDFTWDDILGPIATIE